MAYDGRTGFGVLKEAARALSASLGVSDSWVENATKAELIWSTRNHDIPLRHRDPSYRSSETQEWEGAQEEEEFPEEPHDFGDADGAHRAASNTDMDELVRLIDTRAKKHDAPLKKEIEASAKRVGSLAERVSESERMYKLLKEAATARKVEEIRIIGPESVRVVESSGHKVTPTVLKLAAIRANIMLYGPPGTGKTTIGVKVGEALGLEVGHVSCGPEMTESRLLGRPTLQGTWQESTFARLYANGGVFILDEIDNASADVLVALNTALDNGQVDTGNGRIMRHQDFVLVATANTNGMGATSDFVGRTRLDAATLDRFVFAKIFVDYDEDLENAIVAGILTAAGASPDVMMRAEKVCRWIQGCRHAAQRLGLTGIFFTPRASITAAKLIAYTNPTSDELESLLWTHLDADTKVTLSRESMKWETV